VFYAKTFTTWLNNCGNWLTSWLWGIYDVLDVLQRCVSTTDYNNNNIDNAIDWDPSDSTGSITKVTAGTSITMPSLSNGVCLAGSGFDQLLIAGNLLGGQASALQYKNKNNQPKKCLMPIYYINYYGRANGVACNVFKYIYQRNQFIYNADMRGLRPDRGVADSFFKLYNGCPTGYQLDEFPMNGMDNGYPSFGQWDVSVLCILASENGSEGGQFRNFRYGQGVYTLCDPDDPSSPARDGPLTQDQPFMVQIKNIDYTRCSSTTYTATLASNVRVDATLGLVGTFWVNNMQTHHRDYFEIHNRFTQLTMP
jgi:hypothetical protein